MNLNPIRSHFFQRPETDLNLASGSIVLYLETLRTNRTCIIKVKSIHQKKDLETKRCYYMQKNKSRPMCNYFNNHCANVASKSSKLILFNIANIFKPKHFSLYFFIFWYLLPQS